MSSPPQHATQPDLKYPTTASSEDNTSNSDVVFDEEKLREEKQTGVWTIEAARALIGWKLWVAYVGIFLTSYLYSLDNGTMYAYLYAGSIATRGSFTPYATLQTLQQVVIATLKFPIAKIADVVGRAQGFAVSLFFYCLGFILIASCQNFGTLGVGVFFYAIGNTGTQIMLQIIIADAISTKWRGAAIGLLAWPYLLNFYVSGQVAGNLAGATFTSPIWRWGPGIFAIVFPVAISPIIFSLALSQRAAKKALAPSGSPRRKMTIKSLRTFLSDIDAGGLFLITAGFILFLLPLTMWIRAADSWNTDYIIAMFVVGGVLLVALTPYEWLVASKPVIRRRYLLNKNVVLPAAIGFFDFFSFYLAWTPAYYYVQILKDWDVTGAIYFSNAQSLCLTFFGIMVGFINLATKQYKWTLLAGAIIRMIGMGLMIAFRNANATTAQLVMGQILQGMGGGFLGITLQVAAQVSVPHQDVAMVTAFVLLFAEIGGACGTALLGTIQAQRLPLLLARYLPDASPELLLSLFTAPTVTMASYPLGTPERTGLIEAWNGYMHTLLVVAIVMSAIPIIAAFFLTNYKLNDKQNCVTNEQPLHVTGRAREQAREEILEENSRR